jgi:ketosteroid isomerase-like protein
MGNSVLVADDYRRLEEIQEELVRAWLTHDRSILDRLLAPEWMVIQADGRTSTREGVMLEFDSGGNRLLEGNVDDIKVRVFENCAIVTGRTYARGEYKGRAYEVRLRFTDSFVRRGGEWQAVASHACRIPEM